jgi:transposase
MRTKGSAAELEQRRRLAVQRVRDGWSQVAVASFLGVSPATVQRWMAAYRQHGDDGLAATPHPGRAPFLSAEQERAVLGWLAQDATQHGFPTSLWTCRRVAQLIERRLGVRFNSNYLAAWLAKRGLSPQKPQTRPRERDEAAVARWLAEDWPRVQKKRPRKAPMSS